MEIALIQCVTAMVVTVSLPSAMLLADMSLGAPWDKWGMWSQPWDSWLHIQAQGTCLLGVRVGVDMNLEEVVVIT